VEFSVDAGATWSAPQDAALTAVVGREGIATDESADVLARFRDAAGNVSASAVARTYLVPAPVQGVDSAKTFAGTFAPGGDVDAFTIEVLEGDVLSVRSAARSAKKGGSLVAELDLYGPSHEKLLEGRWPASSKKPGIAKFRAPATGTYVVVVRAAGADAALGGAYTLTESVVRPKANSRIRGKAGHDPSGGRADVATAAFDGALGAVVTGTVAVAGPTELSLVAPDGTVAELVAKPRRGVARVSFALAGGTGSYTLRAVTYGFVPYVLTLVPARRSARASELVAPGTR
jgi:hypothetical protein